MKRIVSVIALSFVILSQGCSQANKEANGDPSKAIITFEKKVHNYGKIEQGSDGLCNFEFQNTGGDALILRNVKTTCGCTSPEWPRTPIKPGKKSKITIKYSTSRPGPFQKGITVYSNASNGTIALTIKGQVIVKKKKE